MLPCGPQISSQQLVDALQYLPHLHGLVLSIMVSCRFCARSILRSLGCVHAHECRCF
jgi:hypothetical protein